MATSLMPVPTGRKNRKALDPFTNSLNSRGIAGGLAPMPSLSTSQPASSLPAVRPAGAKGMGFGGFAGGGFGDPAPADMPRIQPVPGMEKPSGSGYSDTFMEDFQGQRDIEAQREEQRNQLAQNIQGALSPPTPGSEYAGMPNEYWAAAERQALAGIRQQAQSNRAELDAAHRRGDIGQARYQIELRKMERWESAQLAQAKAQLRMQKFQQAEQAQLARAQAMLGLHGQIPATTQQMPMPQQPQIINTGQFQWRGGGGGGGGGGDGLQGLIQEARLRGFKKWNEVPDNVRGELVRHYLR